MNADGTNQKLLIAPQEGYVAGAQSPSWSPNGKYIVYWSSEDFPGSTGTKRMYIMTADGLQKDCVMEDETLYNDAYATDALHFNASGKAILFTGQDDSNIKQLFVLDLKFGR